MQSTMLAARQGLEGPMEVPLSANPLTAVIAMTAIMCVVVLTKLWIRATVIKQVGPDDWSALLGALFVIAITGVIGSVFREAGLDSSSALASPGQINSPVFSDRLFVFLLLSGVPNGFAKLSILFLLLKIFPRQARPVTAYFILAGLGVVTLFYSIVVLYIGIHCGPQPCTVDEQVNIVKATASVNMVLDIYVFVLAVVNVWTVQMSTRNKLGVLAVFATGLLALACSIVVLYYRVNTTTDPNAVWVQVLIPLVLV
ncbi:hypothetical protein Daus18300_012033 [Diaporthe australafricana]|uniref:Rhodopsin domain-containing protein n=1 Tax=Diaporthe australafricana TaxID=127596 RepID=A0ABR3W485_9PEZI